MVDVADVDAEFDSYTAGTREGGSSDKMGRRNFLILGANKSVLKPAGVGNVPKNITLMPVKEPPTLPDKVEDPSWVV